MLDVDARCTRRGSAAAPVTRGPAPRLLLRRRSTQSAACHPQPVAGVREFACRYARAEGRSGGVCGPRVTPDRLAVDARATFDIALTGTGGEQCLDGDAQTWLKVVHSFLLWAVVGGGVSVPPPDPYAKASTSPSSEGVWVAAGDVDSGSSCTQAQKIRQKHRLRIQVVRLRGIGNLGAPPRSGICPLSATRCGFSEFCRGFSLNFVATGRSYAASSSGGFLSSLWCRVRYERPRRI
jgi:hypothetical protein